MRLISIIPLLFTFQIGAAQTPAPNPQVSSEPFTIGETLTFRSGILEEERSLNIYLPHGYSADSATTYPVIYLLDGSVDEDFIHIAGLVQFGSFPWINLLPPTIVVGVANVDRRRDFTYPSTDGEFVAAYPGTGQSARFIRFIEEELQPLVRSRYPIDQQREALIGQSLGGLLATEILFKKPDLFDTYFIVSPSLWYDYESLLASEPVAYTQPKSIYVAVGKEGKVMQRGAKKLYQKLRKGNTTGSKLSFAYFKKHDHGDVLHQAIYTGFTELYGTQKEE